jgi:hypothetical protein
VNEDGFTPQRQNKEASWLPPRELTELSIPRPVSVSSAGTTPLVVFSLFAFVVGLFSVWASILLRREYAFAQRMAAEGLVTPGKVKFATQMRDGRTWYHLVGYRYQVDGKTYNSTTRTSESEANGLPRDRIQVRYLRTNPAQSWIVGLEPSHTQQWVIVLMLGTFFLGWCLGIFFWAKSLLLQRFLLAEGLIAQGRVTGARKLRNVSYASYQFQVDGKDYGGSYPEGLFEKESATGAPVTILYDRDNPRRNARYPIPSVDLGP